MQLKCVKAFGTSKPGDPPVTVPDGAAFDAEYWEAVAPAAPVKPAAAPAPAAAAPTAAPAAPKEGVTGAS